MHRCQQYRVENAVGGATGQTARKEKSVDGEEEYVRKDESRGRGLLQLGAMPAPPAEAFVEDREWG